MAGRQETRRFARVYYDDMVRDHPDVWRDDRLLATWMRLLIACEKAWPSRAEIPRAAKPQMVDRLVALGMLSLGEDHVFELRGFTSDRTKRQETASNAAAVRWHSDSNANAMPYPDQKETRAIQTSEGAREDIVDDYYRLTGRFPTDTVREWVDRLANEFGYDLTSKELGSQYAADPNTRTLLGRVENELKAGRHIATKRQAEAEKARLEAEARAKDISPAKAADNQRALKALMADWFSKDAA